VTARRCDLHPVREDGSEAETVACCRVANHPGSCHRHFAAVVLVAPWVTWARGTNLALECSAGRNLDVASGLSN
jgi:hypothetical protein